MKQILILSVFLLGSVTLLYGQHYRVYFTDKGENTELINQPQKFLSPQAIERRVLRQIPLTFSDLPVSQFYLKELQEQGCEILMASRWFNFALVETQNPQLLQNLSFVKNVEESPRYQLQLAGAVAAPPTVPLTYGLAQNQVEMVNGDYLHNQGLLGQGMTIAVLDGGFTGTLGLHGLDSLRNSGRLKGTYNFVSQDTNVFIDGAHGTFVLSIMAGFIPDTFAGTAVEANYWLLKSENESSETPVEMENWLRAAEFADSVGADIITSSLGYNDFDGTANDFKISDMDGNTTLVTKAADMAAAKGILVIVSAGNEGNDEWERITAPADGDSVLAIGAVNPNGSYASFSSIGPTADGRIKPDVVAQGSSTAFIGAGGPQVGNGTSFSCPVISGLAACLWQSDPTLTNWEVFEAIRGNASQHFTPDNFRGFGIANFMEASWSLSTLEHDLQSINVSVFPNPVKDEYELLISGAFPHGEVVVTTTDISGRPVLRQSFVVQSNVPVTLEAPQKEGAYILSINTGRLVYLKKIIR